MSQLSNQRASHNTSPEHDAVNEKMLSPDHSYSLEEQRVLEEDSHCVPSPAPDNPSSTSGHKSPIHSGSDELSVESNASDSVEREDGISRLLFRFFMFCGSLLTIIVSFISS